MIHVVAHSVSEALSEALYKMKFASKETSRNGDVLVADGPVMTTYLRPQNRVLFSPMRDANPFFHLMEALWMLAGRNDLAFPLKFNSRFGAYSDDGKTVWGAYGYRWRNFFGYDQLKAIVTELRRNPDSRRAVLSMWNAMPTYDEASADETIPDSAVAANGGKDVPCNTHAYFDLRGGKLNMTVCCRSNDAIWGAYGANAVHFSVLLEYMAAWLQVPVGQYRQFSNNFHIYTDVLSKMTDAKLDTAEQLHALALDVEGSDLYKNSPGGSTIVDCPMDRWNYELNRFIKRDGIPNDSGWESEFFRHTARPMYMAYEAWREKRYADAATIASFIECWDWNQACCEWLARRQEKRDAR